MSFNFNFHYNQEKNIFLFFFFKFKPIGPLIIHNNITTATDIGKGPTEVLNFKMNEQKECRWELLEESKVIVVN